MDICECEDYGGANPEGADLVHGAAAGLPGLHRQGRGVGGQILVGVGPPLRQRVSAAAGGGRIPMGSGQPAPGHHAPPGEADLDRQGDHKGTTRRNEEEGAWWEGDLSPIQRGQMHFRREVQL